MGYEHMQLVAVTRVSRHNSPRDDNDNKAWNAFVVGVRELAEASDLSIEVVPTDENLPEDQWS